MTRFLGCIGINEGFKETDPGTFVPNIKVLEVVGEMRNTGARWARHEQGEGTTALHVLSVITPEDQVALYHEVAWVEWQGLKWAVTGVQYKRPRVEFTLGGQYNE